jgi:hypothetical protein
MRHILIVTAFLLTGCITDANADSRIEGDEYSVSIKDNSAGPLGDLLLADHHCGKYEKVAVFRGVQGDRRVFGCAPLSPHAPGENASELGFGISDKKVCDGAAYGNSNYEKLVEERGLNCATLAK